MNGTKIHGRSISQTNGYLAFIITKIADINAKNLMHVCESENGAKALLITTKNVTQRNVYVDVLHNHAQV